jgi:hypothetical protein
MNKKGFELLGENITQLVIAVLCIGILLILGVTLYDFLVGNSGDIKKAEYELKEMNASLRSITDDKTERNYIVTTIQDWFLFTDESGNLCGGSFCLCACKDEGCKGNVKACIATDKFVSIKENGQSKRMIQLKSPSDLKISLSNKEVYPFNGDAQVLDYYLVAYGIIPIFFKFDTEWKWSADLDNWMLINTTVVKGGYLNGQEPMKSKIEFLSFFSKIKDIKYSNDKGAFLFNQIGVHKSNGVYIIQK